MTFINKKYSLAVLGLYLIPNIAFAQNILDTIDSVMEILDALIPVIISFAVILFLWGLMKYVIKADDTEARKSSRSLMIWGVVIIFVMISVWGLVNFLADSISLDSQNVPNYPELR